MQDVVVSREQHQHQHKRQSDTETKLLRTLRQRLSANRLHRIEQKVSAIQKRHRKQVQQADGNREDGRKVNQGRKADGGHLAGDLGDPDRAADLIGILPAGENSADIGNSPVNDEPCLLDAQPNSGRWVHWFGDGITRSGGTGDTENADPVDVPERILDLAKLRRAVEFHDLIAALDGEHQRR